MKDVDNIIEKYEHWLILAGKIVIVILLMLIMWLLLPPKDETDVNKAETNTDSNYILYVDGLELQDKTITINEGTSKSLMVKTRSGEEKSVAYTAEDTDIVEIHDGEINAIHPGTTEILIQPCDDTNASHTIPVTVKKRTGGTKKNPLDASLPFTTDIYDYGEYIGRYTIQLSIYKEGDEAWELVHQNKNNIKPKKGQTYVYMKFYIKHEKGNKTVDGSDIVNFFTNLYERDFSKKLDNIGWGTNFNNAPCVFGAKIEPGDVMACDIAFLVEKSQSGVGYCLETGKTEYGESDYTCFIAK